MRRSASTLLVVLLGLTLAPWPGPPASASCAAPSLALEGHHPADGRATLVRGEEVTVIGRGFVDGCDDTGGGTVLGCGGDTETEVPLTDVELVVVHGRAEARRSLDTEDAGEADDNELGQVTWTFTVPETMEPGPVTLETDRSDPLNVRISR